MVLVAIIAAIFSWSITPVPFEYVDSDKKIVVLGATSHILPLVRIINVVLHPFRRVLVPIELENLKKEAIASFGGGYDDFGTLCDWEALEKFAEIADERAHLLGRYLYKENIAQILKTHLAISKIVQENPEILDETIEKPIFVAASPRSGGSFLHRVLADTFDQELVPNYFYEVVVDPIELPDTISRKELVDARMKATSVVNPPLMIMHEFTNAEDVEEDAGWGKHTMRGAIMSVIIPSIWHHLNIYQESTAEINKNFWEILLKIKQWKAGRKLRFILKAADHLFYLPYLSETFPDARFVTVSRDEDAMYKSALVLTHTFRQLFVANTHINETVCKQDLKTCHLLKALEVAHDKKYKSQVMSVSSEDRLFTNTFEIVANFAKHADLPWDGVKQAHARSVIAKRLSWKKHKAIYRMADFGLEDDGIKERLATLCEELPETVEGLEEFYNLKA